mgnify:CR=1 FL=1
MMMRFVTLQLHLDIAALCGVCTICMLMNSRMMMDIAAGESIDLNDDGMDDIERK